MSKTYKIHRWDVVLFGNSNDPTPIVYIKADDDLLKFAKDNSDAFLVELHVAGSIYDKKSVVGIWAKSSEIPNCRAEFFKETELYVLVLQAPWYGYPDCLGDVVIFGLHGGVPVESGNINIPHVKDGTQLRVPSPVITENYQGNCNGNIPVEGLIGIFAAFVVVIFIIVFISKK
jgi:hypothetical protein